MPLGHILSIRLLFASLGNGCCRRPATLFLMLAVTGSTLRSELLLGQATATTESVDRAETLADVQEFSVASVFSDHMVLQRGVRIPVWGQAPPGTTVRVMVGNQTVRTSADAQGKWRLKLEPLEVGSPLKMTIRSDDQTIRWHDVLVGDVWLASGQSNMEWSLARTDHAEAEIAAADYPRIRLIDVPHCASQSPQESFVTDGWRACRPATARDFSAVAYFFGRHLHKTLDVPIGLIGCNWGGTPMEAWTSREALAASATFAELVADATTSRTASDPPPGKGRRREQRSPSRLFNGMLHPLIPYAMRGAIWYQGEANAGRADEYLELSQVMIQDWRDRWELGDFPFVLVQLSAWEPGGRDWPLLREAQTQTVREVPVTAMAVTTDIGERTDIHPRNKQDVGYRLALAALALSYHQPLVCSGPMYRDMEIDGRQVTLGFHHTGSGLQVRGGTLQGFKMAGMDGIFHPATATLAENRVVVTCDRVLEPAAVRYNWAAFPTGNLYNGDGLPAVAFRTPL